MLTAENLPKCRKCKEKVSPGATYLSGMWLCATCLINYLEKIKKEKQEQILQE